MRVLAYIGGGRSRFKPGLQEILFLARHVNAQRF